MIEFLVKSKLHIVIFTISIALVYVGFINMHESNIRSNQTILDVDQLDGDRLEKLEFRHFYNSSENEPTGNLDSNSGDQIKDVLDQLNQNGTTICMVTQCALCRQSSHTA